MTRRMWTVALVAGAFSTALIGGVALAGLQPFAGSDGTVIGGPAATLVAKDQPRDKIKEVLDALVTKGTITKAQEDAILEAFAAQAPKPSVPSGKPVRPNAPNIKSFLGDLTKAASDYLGMDTKSLLAQLRGGKSLADVANGLSAQGKSAQGLIDTLAKTANDRVDQAVAAKKLTAEQAGSLKPKIAAEITSFVNRSFTKPLFPQPFAPAKPSPTPKS